MFYFLRKSLPPSFFCCRQYWLRDTSENKSTVRVTHDWWISPISEPAATKTVIPGRLWGPKALSEAAAPAAVWCHRAQQVPGVGGRAVPWRCLCSPSLRRGPHLLHPVFLYKQTCSVTGLWGGVVKKLESWLRRIRAEAPRLKLSLECASCNTVNQGVLGQRHPKVKTK